MKNKEYPEEYTPTIPKEIIEYLEKILPARDYNSTDELAEIMFYSGKRAVVNLLKSLNDRKY